MLRYVAFLRGINVGGNKKVPMTELKAVLELMGFKNVKTILASGNVMFETKRQTSKALEEKLRTKLEKVFGFEIPILIRELSELELMIKENPFKDIKLTPQIRLYVTFLPYGSKAKLKVPYFSPDRSLAIIKLNKTCIFSVLDLSKSRTPEAMGIIEKEFSKNVTTRNWNTIVKILE